jgi:hypothetical protein
MAFVAGGANDGSAVDSNLLLVKQWWDDHAAAVSGSRIPHKDLAPLMVVEEDAPMAAVEQVHVEVEDGWREEALIRDVVRRVKNGPEVGEPGVAHDEAEDGRLPVVVAKATEELGVGDDVAPQLADGGEAGQGGGLRREEEEDLPE